MVEPTDIGFLSPLLLEHVDMLGRFDFTLPDCIATRDLRPLHVPASRQERLAEFP